MLLFPLGLPFISACGFFLNYRPFSDCTEFDLQRLKLGGERLIRL